jgi:two-component system cell cycle response regulator
VSATVLLVDDVDAMRDGMRLALEEAQLGLRLLEASDGAEALRIAMSEDVDIVVSDIIMPRMTGIDLLRAIRQQKDPEALPVILITSRSDGETREASYEAGVSDYITKPYLPAELVARVQVQLRLLALRTELARANERHKQLASHDELTGLANRRHFLEQSRRELARSLRYEFAMSIAVLDLDGFRDLNSRAGYVVADAVVSELALLLSRIVRGADVLARLGGERFAALLPQTDLAEARSIAVRLCESVRNHTFPQQKQGGVTASIGFATLPTPGIVSVDDLVNAAERSLDLAKERGGGRVEAWDAAIEA